MWAETDINMNDMDFIICVNDEYWYSECKKYIQELRIPDGMNIHIIPVWNAQSMCQGYNIGMKQGNAKYKVYLHQDTFIINLDFITDVLHIFEDNSNIGIIGLIGADEIKSKKLHGVLGTMVLLWLVLDYLNSFFNLELLIIYTKKQIVLMVC